MADLVRAEGDWRELGLCAQVDLELFFPEKGGSTREAKQVCMACEVRPQCLRYALEHRERWGIWGGLSERERRRLLSQQDQQDRRTPRDQPVSEPAAVAS